MGDGNREGTVAVRAFYAVIALCLLVLLTGTAIASGEGKASAGILGDRRGGEIAYGFGDAVPVPVYGCADLASTEPFRSRGLEYVYSPEFAEAVEAVANGKSRYSPPDIPAPWKTAAADWRAYLAARSGGESGRMQSALFSDPAGSDPELLLRKGACNPALLYLASLEYRTRPGHEGVTPVFPRLVRTASKDLGALVAAKRQMAASYAKRSADILSKISEAERMGARECQPNELAAAKVRLETARRAAEGVRSSVRETDASFAKAEQSAQDLLAKRQYAFQKGFKCFPE